MLQSLHDELALARYMLDNARYQDQVEFYTLIVTEIEEEIAEIID